MPRYAAVDIGSNSVRMMAADVDDQTTTVLAEERQVTRLGESVFRVGQVSTEALQFLCAQLTRMAQTYGRFDVRGIRAVATSAVRDTSNQQEFLERTSAALGTDVEIISGPEEARLIHLGVEARWPRPNERTLMIDVGGGSAELIVSEGGKLADAVSRPLGAVRLTELFLKHDPPAADELHMLSRNIEEKLQPFVQRHAGATVDRVVATSATAAAIVCSINNVPRAQREAADRVRAKIGQIRDLYTRLSSENVTGRRKITGIGPRRAEIIVAGAAVFLRTLEMLQLPSLYYCRAGVRDGIIADLAARGVGRELMQLSREQRSLMETMAARYSVDLAHTRKVAQLSHSLFNILHTVQQLPPAAGKLLEAAAYLHDIGHYVSGTGHHKHSAYLVSNSDLPGFNDRERIVISLLCRFHRKSMPQARHSQFQALDPELKKLVVGLTPLLRIADALDRGHDGKVAEISVAVKNAAVSVGLKADTDADLEVWAAGETAEIFRQVYRMPIVFERVRAAA